MNIFTYRFVYSFLLLLSSSSTSLIKSHNFIFFRGKFCLTVPFASDRKRKVVQVHVNYIFLSLPTAAKKKQKLSKQWGQEEEEEEKWFRHYVCIYCLRYCVPLIANRYSHICTTMKSNVLLFYYNTGFVYIFGWMHLPSMFRRCSIFELNIHLELIWRRKHKCGTYFDVEYCNDEL